MNQISMNRKKVGKFYMSVELINEEPERVSRIFSLLNFVPVRVECLCFENKMEYVGISTHFAEAVEGAYVSEYLIDVISDEFGWPQVVSAKPVTQED